MEAQRPGSFDKKAFIAAVEAAIAAKTPTDAGPGRQVQGVGQDRGGQGRGQGPGGRGQAGPDPRHHRGHGRAAPDQSKAVPKPVTPMGPEPPGHVAPVPAAGAVPKPAPAEQLNLAAGHARGRRRAGPGRRHRRPAGRVQRAAVRRGAGRQEGRRRPRRDRTRGVPGRGDPGHRARTRPRPRRRPPRG